MIGAAIQAGASLINGIFDRNNQKKMQEAAIKAQKEANEANLASQEKINAANVASQEKINQAQLDQSSHINDLMRYDSKHAISDKLRDIKRAGLSTADPNQQGFSTAALSSPHLAAAQQQAAMVDPVFDQQGVSNIIASKRASMQNLTDFFATLADTKYKEAQGRNLDVDTEGKKIENTWKDAEKNAQLAAIHESIDNMSADTSVKKETIERLKAETTSIGQSTKLLMEQVSDMKFKNKTNAERFEKEMANLQASTNDLISSKNLKDKEASLKDLEKRIKKVEAVMAEHGVNFNGQNYFDTIARLALTPNGAKVMPAILTFISDGFSEIASMVGSAWNDNKKVVAKTAKKAGKKSLIATLFGQSPIGQLLLGR